MHSSTITQILVSVQTFFGDATTLKISLVDMVETLLFSKTEPSMFQYDVSEILKKVFMFQDNA